MRSHCLELRSARTYAKGDPRGNQFDAIFGRDISLAQAAIEKHNRKPAKTNGNWIGEKSALGRNKLSRQSLRMIRARIAFQVGCENENARADTPGRQHSGFSSPILYTLSCLRIASIRRASPILPVLRSTSQSIRHLDVGMAALACSEANVGA
jgi:hypothetical protein